jgi:hypothetical protein
MARIAEHRSTCPECDDMIVPGDPIITTVDLQWAHEKCEPSSFELPPSGEICDRCWMVKPCGCDDE